jgi:hypothetical protein
MFGRETNKTTCNQNFVLLIPCVFLQLIRQPTNALNKIKFMTSIKLLNVSAPGVETCSRLISCHELYFIKKICWFVY